MKDIIQFLAELKKNNNREWFSENKKRYELYRKQFIELVQSIICHLQYTDNRITDLDAAQSIFRIYRDVRFSNDKTPYKAHFSAYIARGGRKSQEAGYYLHISEDELFAGGGVYAPQKEELLAVRQEISYRPEEYSSIVNHLKELAYTQYEQDKLKKGPKDFPSDAPYIDLIKYKHYFLSADLSKKELYKADPSLYISGILQGLFPYTQFLNQAIEFKGNE